MGKPSPVEDNAENVLAQHIPRHGAGDEQCADARAVAIIYTHGAQMRIESAGHADEHCAGDDHPEIYAALGSTCRNAVCRRGAFRAGRSALRAVWRELRVRRGEAEQKHRHRNEHQERGNTEEKVAALPAEALDHGAAKRVENDPDHTGKRRAHAHGQPRPLVKPAPENERRGIEHQKCARDALHDARDLKKGDAARKAHRKYGGGKEQGSTAEQEARIHAREYARNERQHKAAENRRNEHIKRERAHGKAQLRRNGGDEYAPAVIDEPHAPTLQKTAAG